MREELQLASKSLHWGNHLELKNDDLLAEADFSCRCEGRTDVFIHDGIGIEISAGLLASLPIKVTALID